MPNFNRSRLCLERLESRETPAISAVGPEFRLNAFITGLQNAPAIALDADGDFVAAWTSAGEDGAGNGIVARRYNKDGTPLAAAFVVNSFPTGDQSGPAVAMNAAGDFVVIWSSAAQDSDGLGVFGQRFDAAGNALGAEFQINQFTTGNQVAAAVAMDATGGFVVAWNSDGQLGQSVEVYARRYAANGLSLGDEFRANSFTINVQSSAAVGMSALGDFVIAWNSNLQDSSGNGIYAQVYGRDGSTIGGEFRVNTFTTGSQVAPAVAMSAAGNFLVVWTSPDQVSPTSGNDVFGQRYSANGNSAGGEFLINSITTGSQNQVAVALDASGDFAVSFSTAQAGANEIAVRPGTAAGVLGTQLAANSFTTGVQSASALALSANGDFVVAWAGEGSGDADGIFAQRYDQSVDDAGPYVTGISTPSHPNPVVEGELILTTVPSFTAAFSEDMSVTGGSSGANSVTNKNNWQLRLNGTNIAGTAITSITYGFNSVTRRHEATFNLASPLGIGNYQLEPLGTIQDLAGNAIDGNFDGVPGGAFVRTFQVAFPRPVGPEFRVNTRTTGNQSTSAVASDAVGNFVVVWHSDAQDGESLGIYGQRYSAAGAPLGTEFRVNTFTTSTQRIADVAMDQDGDFVVVWESIGQDGSGSGVYGQRFAANGATIGGEFHVSTTTQNAQELPGVAMDVAGNFVVVWESNDQDGSQFGIFAQRYGSNGAALGGEFRINSYTTNNQSSPDVAMDADGDFIVAWQSLGQVVNNAEAIFCRRFDENGVALDATDVQVNIVTTADQLTPSIAAMADGSFVVAWQDNSAVQHIVARRYTAAGVAATGGILVDTTTPTTAIRPAVALDAGGIAVVTWDAGSLSDRDVFFGRIDPFGNLIGSDTRVNSATADQQTSSAVAAQPQGGFVVTWNSLNQDGANYGVYAQRFGVAPAAPPQVASVQVNDGTAQRSRVTSLTVTFDSVVTFAGAVGNAFTLARNGGGAVNFTATASVVNNVTVVILNAFTGGETQSSSFRDGRYTLTVVASQVSANSQQMASNFTFGDAEGLYRYFGDRDGNRAVDNVDFFFFRPALGSSFPALNYVVGFDFDGDNNITNTDFFQFRNRLGTQLP